jgi:hypothetical protein
MRRFLTGVFVAAAAAAVAAAQVSFASSKVAPVRQRRQSTLTLYQSFGPRRTQGRLGAPAINLPPGVVTVARLRLPDGTPFSLTLQRIRFQGHQYECLAVTRPFRGGRATSSNCQNPLPLPDTPLVLVTGGLSACKPRPVQLIWGVALKNVSVALRSAGHEQTVTRRAVPAALRARGSVFFIWARGAPDALIARHQDGKIAETYALNSRRVPPVAAECNEHR